MQWILLRRRRQTSCCKMWCFTTLVKIDIGTSPLTSKSIRARKDSFFCHHLLNCNYSCTFEEFRILCYENKKYPLELKVRLLIMRDKPPLNQNIRSAPLYLFEWVLVTLFTVLCGLQWSIFYLFYLLDLKKNYKLYFWICEMAW